MEESYNASSIFFILQPSFHRYDKANEMNQYLSNLNFK